MSAPKSLLSLEFILLAGISFFAFCNMAVFYGFYDYLGHLGIPAEWRGVLLGLEPFTAFGLRLLLIPLISVGKAARPLCCWSRPASPWWCASFLKIAAPRASACSA